MSGCDEKYAKPIHCPQCDKNLDASVAIGLGGMACPEDHGAWADDETLRRLAARLKNVAAIRQDSAAEKPYIRVGELADELRHKHPAEIYCPDCGIRLEAEAAVSAGAVGLTGMACPKQHGAWIDHGVLIEIRRRLNTADRK